jgi:hypothetical protein
MSTVARRIRSAAGVLLLASSASAQTPDLAPSCAATAAEFAYSGEFQGGDLFAVSEGSLRDAAEVSFKPRSKEYRLYYVYQNTACQNEDCVETPVILIKTLKVTNADPGPFVYLMREGSSRKTSIARDRYDAFHNDPMIIPREPFNSFHIFYHSPSGGDLRTNTPVDRRQKYLFSDVPPGRNAWLTARNYTFKRNTENQPQCIPIDIQLQRGTESAYIEIVEVEDGSGGVPTNITHWPLKMETR